MIETSKKISFDGLGIAPQIIEILDKIKFTTPTPIQYQSIPAAIEGKDVMGIAQTGTGKTLAFCIPMVQRILKTNGRGLVIAPTRELAIQIEETFRKIGNPLNVQTVVLIGGAPIGRQIGQLKRKPQVVIATPGRLIDHLEKNTVNLKEVNVLVLDEADRMLDMGFAPQIKRVLEHVPKDKQTMFFSATMPKEIVTMASQYMNLPIRVEIAPSGTTAERVEQEMFFVEKGHKTELLQSLLKEHRGSALVFTRTKYGAKKIAKAVRDMGFEAAEIHSNRTLGQRKKALEGFKTGRYRVLVATDIAARGIDVKAIELVVNYDLPATAEDYVHRIGRTGRAGHEGRAISFATPEQKSEVQKIEKLVKTSLPVSNLPESLKKKSSPQNRGRTSGSISSSGSRQQKQRPKHHKGRYKSQHQTKKRNFYHGGYKSNPSSNS